MNRNTDLRIAQPLFPEVDRQVAADLKRLEPKIPIHEREWVFPAGVAAMAVIVAILCTLMQMDIDRRQAHQRRERIEAVQGMAERQIAAESALRRSIEAIQQ